MRKFIVEVTQIVEVELDEAKFDETFMQEFRDAVSLIGAGFYQFDTIEEHAEYLARMHACGIYDLDGWFDTFIEGYGPQNEMGIKAVTLSTETEVQS